MNNKFFPEVNGNFGFGCMRLPTVGGSQGDQSQTIDQAKFNEMVDAFMDAGFNYFDTAAVYHSGQSETALREGLVKRYPRDKFVLTDKLTGFIFKTAEDVRPLFERQLASCGVDYFDFYLMHGQSSHCLDQFRDCRCYEQVAEFKKEGKIRHMGISFHDTAEVLDGILTEHPDIEVVQLQFNYLDYEDDKVQSRLCYETCVKHGKPVVVMEPVKGGRLANLHPDAKSVLDALDGGSPASYALRFAASHENIHMVLSGMSDMAQMQDNLATMKNFRPLNDKEKAAVAEAAKVLRDLPGISCTGCRYCVDGCPQNINIPGLFELANTRTAFPGTDLSREYGRLLERSGKAGDCVECGQCEDACPQHLPIRELLKGVADTFEK